MKASYWIALALGAGLCVSLTACGGGGRGYGSMPNQPTPPSQPQTVMLSVNDVLTKANTSSETDDPFTVNDAAVAVNPPNDEESDPASVD